MNNVKYGVISGVIALAVALGVSFFVERRPVPPEGLPKIEEPRVGAIPGSRIDGVFTINGLHYFPVVASLQVATSAYSSASPQCSLKSPNATTTLVLDQTALLFNTAATGTGAKIKVFRGINEHATTTLLFARDVLAPGGASVDGAVGTTTALTANTTSVTQVMIAPNQFINFTIEGLPISHGRFLGSGKCQAVFMTAFDF